MQSPHRPGQELADPARSITAFVADWLCTVPFQLIGLVTLIGQFIRFAVLPPFWLLRDIGGASLVKRLTGLRVIDYAGQKRGLASRMRRNIFLVLPLAAILLPVIGAVGAAFGVICVALLELYMVVTRGERLGDRNAKCLVISNTQT